MSGQILGRCSVHDGVHPKPHADKACSTHAEARWWGSRPGVQHLRCWTLSSMAVVIQARSSQLRARQVQGALHRRRHRPLMDLQVRPHWARTTCHQLRRCESIIVPYSSIIGEPSAEPVQFASPPSDVHAHVHQGEEVHFRTMGISSATPWPRHSEQSAQQTTITNAERDQQLRPCSRRWRKWRRRRCGCSLILLEISPYKNKLTANLHAWIESTEMNMHDNRH